MPGRKGKEELLENEQPLSQLSKIAIQKLGESPDPGVVYWLQLIHVCLDKGVLRLRNGGMKGPFLDLLDKLDRMRPKDLQDFLGRAEDEEGPEVVMRPDPIWDPEELAGVLIYTLGIVAGEKFYDYPFPPTD